jgi:hypothetical protein
MRRRPTSTSPRSMSVASTAAASSASTGPASIRRGAAPSRRRTPTASREHQRDRRTRPRWGSGAAGARRATPSHTLTRRFRTWRVSRGVRATGAARLAGPRRRVRRERARSRCVCGVGSSGGVARAPAGRRAARVAAHPQQDIAAAHQADPVREAGRGVGGAQELPARWLPAKVVAHLTPVVTGPGDGEDLAHDRVDDWKESWALACE